MIEQNLSTLRIHKLTQDQFDRIVGTTAYDENALYFTPDEEIDLSPYATIEQLNTKADAEHSHGWQEITGLENQLESKVPSTRCINGISLSNDITLSPDVIGAEPEGALDAAKSYTDGKIADLVDTAPETLDTLGKISKALQEDDDVMNALNAAITGKADKTHGHDVATSTTDGFMSKEQVKNLDTLYSQLRNVAIYIQTTEPVDAPTNAIWIDTGTISTLNAEDVMF